MSVNVWGRWLAAGLVALLAAGLVVGCTPKRLVDLAKVKDDRTEAMVRADRYMETARKSIDERKLDEAQAAYLAALGEYPLIAEAHQGLGNIYEMKGDRLSALAEYIAHTEVEPMSKFFMDRMVLYLFAKYAANPAGPEEVDPVDQATALVELSRALADQRGGDQVRAMQRLTKVKAGLPRAGLVEYLTGRWKLVAGDRTGALDALTKAVAFNSYFARCLLVERVERDLPGLLERLVQSLAAELTQRPSDAQTTLVLAAVHLRLGDFEGAIKVARKALAWGRASWDVLFIKAVAHDALGQATARDQAMADIEDLGQDLSMAFTSWEPSLFTGLLGGVGLDLAAGRLADGMPEPRRSYFRWRLLAEAGRTEAAAEAEAKFHAVMGTTFPAGEFDNLAGSGPIEDVPKSLAEFRGEVQSRLADAMQGFWHCDRARRDKRARVSGRVNLRVELGEDGQIAHLGIAENTTRDPFLAYCVAAKILGMRFPKPFLATEVFRPAVMFGPEIDGLSKGGK